MHFRSIATIATFTSTLVSADHAWQTFSHGDVIDPFTGVTMELLTAVNMSREQALLEWHQINHEAAIDDELVYVSGDNRTQYADLWDPESNVNGNHHLARGTGPKHPNGWWFKRFWKDCVQWGVGGKISGGGGCGKQHGALDFLDTAGEAGFVFYLSQLLNETLAHSPPSKWTRDHRARCVSVNKKPLCVSWAKPAYTEIDAHHINRVIKFATRCHKYRRMSAMVLVDDIKHFWQIICVSKRPNGCRPHPCAPWFKEVKLEKWLRQDRSPYNANKADSQNWPDLEADLERRLPGYIGIADPSLEPTDPEYDTWDSGEGS